MKRKKFQYNNSVLAGVMYGILGALLSSFLLAMIMTLCINNEYIGIGTIRICAHIIRGIAALLGSVVTILSTGRKNTIVGFLCAAVYYLVLLITALLFSDRVGGDIISGLLSVMLAAAIAVFLLRGNKKTGFTSAIGKRRG